MSATVVRQLALIGLAVVVYFGVRGITEGGRQLAIDNARSLMRLEDRVGISWEPALRDLVLRHHELVTLANWVYIWGHWPLIISTLIWLYRRRPSHYFWLRDAMFVSGAVGLVIFAGFPVAPPRLTDGAVVDTVTRWSHAYRVLQPPGFVNRYAALPSLHAGWNVILGIVMFRSVSSVAARVFAVAAPIAMCLAVVATANHYVIDVVAGAALALAGLVIAARRYADPGRVDGGAARGSADVGAGDGFRGGHRRWRGRRARGGRSGAEPRSTDGPATGRR